MQQMTQMQVDMVALGHRYDGLKKLFDAAAMAGNGAECDELRFQLHTLLDAQLDIVAQTMVVSRAFMQSKNN